MSIGIHVSKKSKVRDVVFKNMRDAIKEECELLNLSAVQIYTHGPMNKKKNEMDYQGIKKYCEEKNIKIYVHGSYVSVGIWQVNQLNKNESVGIININHIRDQLISGKCLGAEGVVIHLPKKAPEIIAETMAVLSNHKMINRLKKNPGRLPKILLEMPASRPDEKTYETPEKLNNLVKLLNEEKIDLEWGICLDTAHQWSCGVDMGDLNIFNTWFRELTPATLERINLIHFNGALKNNFSKGKDIHIIPMSKEDAVWGGIISKDMRDFIEKEKNDLIKYDNDLYEHLTEDEINIIRKSTLNLFVKYAKKNNISLICEINRGDFIETKLCVDVLNNLKA